MAAVRGLARVRLAPSRRRTQQEGLQQIEGRKIYVSAVIAYGQNLVGFQRVFLRHNFVEHLRQLGSLDGFLQEF